MFEAPTVKIYSSKVVKESSRKKRSQWNTKSLIFGWITTFCSPLENMILLENVSFAIKVIRDFLKKYLLDRALDTSLIFHSVVHTFDESELMH